MSNTVIYKGVEYKVTEDLRLVPVQKTFTIEDDLILRGDDVVGRFTTLSQKQADATGLPKDTVTIVLSDKFATSVELVKVENNNSKSHPDWAEGSEIGTRIEYAIVVK